MSGTEVEWIHHSKIAHAREESKISRRPVLLNFHAPSCAGSQRLEEQLFSDEEVKRCIEEKTIPVRVVTDSENYDLSKAEIIGKHIFIWSPSVQMTDAKGVFFHEFANAPRYTRLDAFYRSVHHDLEGSILKKEFLENLELGLIKHQLNQVKDYDGAYRRLSAFLKNDDLEPVIKEEAVYWKGIAENKGFSKEPAGIVNESMTPLGRAVARVCEVLVSLPENMILRDWNKSRGPAGWYFYTDNLREVVYGLWQSVIDFARLATIERAGTVTEAQHILMQHHRAFRDMLALVAGFGDDILDANPLETERTIRNHYAHCALAEWWAHTPQIRYARQLFERGEEAKPLVSQTTLNNFGAPPVCFGTIEALLAHYEEVHWKVIDEFEDISDEELGAPTIWWESEPLDLRFRLNRLGWHLRDHSTIIENVLQAQGKAVTEQQRFARQLLSASGEAEASLIGYKSGKLMPAYNELVKFVNTRADQLMEFRNG